MKSRNLNHVCMKKYKRNLILLLSLFISGAAYPQKLTVLPQNGSYSTVVAPQGSYRYQRQFYLITPKEMQNSGLINTAVINSIGFTIGKEQSDTTKGAFKVYLQNTTDTLARNDNAFTVVDPTTNILNLTGLIPGNYEWQVFPNCSPISIDTARAYFTTTGLKVCNNPTHLLAGAITSTSATLSWYSPASTGIVDFVVQYKNTDSVNWISSVVATNSINISGLTVGATYQWGVKTRCSTDSSEFNGSYFQTEPLVSACNAPTLPSSLVLTDTTALISWTGAVGATNYTIQYRRNGTLSWNTRLSFSNSTVLTGLKKGTSYEWAVRTNCSLGSGSFVSGSSFLTTGTMTCYAPASIFSDSLTDSTAVISWSSTGASSYKVRYRVVGSIAWSNVTAGMTLVHNDSILIPKIKGSYDITFANGSAFAYSGGGVYVAYEYVRNVGALPSSNISLCTNANSVLKGSGGQDSLNLILSLGLNNSSVLPVKLSATNLRPETRFGSSAMKDSVEVANVYALGNNAIPYGNPSTISALIKNKSHLTHTYAVTLTIKDQITNVVRNTFSQNATVIGDSLLLVTFPSWSPTIFETDSIIVSIPAESGENVTVNNRNFYIQNVDPYILSYADGSSSITGAGFDTLSGLLVNRHRMNGCGKVNAARIYLTNSAKNHPLRAVVLNSAGTIIDSSAYHTFNSSNVNSYQAFYFTALPTLRDTVFYIGLMQTADLANGYMPLGVQWEGIDIRRNAYYRADSIGGNLKDTLAAGRLMIRAEIIPAVPKVTIGGAVSLCSGGTNTLTAFTTSTRFASQVLDYSSQNFSNNFSANQVLGAPDVYPNYLLSNNAWVSATADGQREFLVLRFPNPGRINYVDIYETANPGAVDSVYVKDPSSGYVQVYSSMAVAAPLTARIKRISFTSPAFNVSEIRIAMNSAAITGYNAIDAVGIGFVDSLNIGGNTYSWSPGGATTQSISVSTIGTKSVVVNGSGSCPNSASVSVAAHVSSTPTITASGSTSVCVGDPVVTLTSSKLSGNTWSTGETTQKITINTAVASSQSYRVWYSDGSSCPPDTSAYTTVNVYALPVLTTTGDLSICPGSTSTLGLGSAYSQYQWSTGSTNASINVSTATNVSVRVTDANGCKETAFYTTSILPAPHPVITGNLDICLGGSTTLDAGSSYAGYNWSSGPTSQTISVGTANSFTVTVTDGNNCTASTNVTTQIIPVPSPTITGVLSFCPGGTTQLIANIGYTHYSWSTTETTRTINVSTSGVFTVIVTSGNGCTGSASATTASLIAPTPSISGDLTICPNSSSILDAGINYINYLWSTGANTHSIFISTGGTYSVSVTDSNGCTGTASALVSAANNLPGSIGTINGVTSGLCNQNGIIYSVTPVPNVTNYLWTVPAQATIVSGQGTPSVSIDFGAIGNGFISVVGLNNCGQTAASTLQLKGLSNTPGPISGQTTGLCSKSGIVYSVLSVPGNPIYDWTVSYGASIISGQGTNTIIINYINFVSGNISVKARNTCGSSLARTLFIQGAPEMPPIISGPSSLICAQTNIIYSIPLLYGANSYSWTVPSSGKIMSGQGTSQIVVNFTNKLTTGNICVVAINPCGNSTASCLSITGLPAIPGFITGSTGVCLRQANVIYSITPVAGATSYTWTVPNKASIRSGQGTTSISVTYNGYGGNVSVSAKNACGSSLPSSLPVSIICRSTQEDNINDVTVNEVDVFPNPSNGKITIHFVAFKSEKLNLNIYDVLGHIVTKSDINTIEGENNIELDLLSLVKGVYFLNVNNENLNFQTARIVLQ